MNMKKLTLIATVVLLAGLLSLAAFAQDEIVEEKTEVRKGEVIHVDGQTLTFLENGVVKTAEIPADRVFNVDGKQLKLADLKPGMKVTATLKTKTITIPGTKAVTIRNGEVVQAHTNAVVVREGKKYTKYIMPDTFRFDVDGKLVDVHHLKKGMILNATIITETPPQVVEEKTLKLDATMPEPEPTPAPAPKPATLPKTGSPLPSAGLLGLLFVFCGACLTLFRRLV
jgi:hypothetical protein